MDNNMEKLLEETINSFDGAKRAAVKPYLLTRILARLNKQEDVRGFWTKAAQFLSKPAVAISTFIIVIALNSILIIKEELNDDGRSTAISNAKEDYTTNINSIYEFENLEP